MVSLLQFAHAAEPYPRTAEELVAAQAGLDAVHADALVHRMEDYLRLRLGVPLDTRDGAFQPARDAVVPVSVSLPSRNARIGNAFAVEAMRLDVAALIAAGTDKRQAGVAHRKFFSLVIEGKAYVLEVVEVLFDPVFGMQHVLATIVNATDACARFTLDARTGSIAGTVTSGLRRYRIVSGNERGTQLVFRLGPAQAGAGELITSEKLVPSAAAQVERRNAQVERLAQIRPDSVSLPKNGATTHLVGGAIGKVDLARLGEPGAIAHLLGELSVFTRATGDEAFEIVSSGPEVNGRRNIRFRQLINGIPVDFTSQLDVGPEGDVLFLQARVFDPTGVPTRLISRQEAMRIATEVIEREIGYLGVVKINWMPDVGMKYVARSMSQEEHAIELTPTWRMPASVRTLNGRGMGESALVLVNAATGKAEIRLNQWID